MILLNGNQINITLFPDNTSQVWKLPEIIGPITITWELDALDLADFIIMYFDPATKSPISLLELGLYSSTGKLVVCCPDGFWRKGNVDIVCKRLGIMQRNNLKEVAKLVKFAAQIKRSIKK